ncbi:MAG: hydrogenase maturation protease [Armatimonadota bacterium]|jgi:hydrogenase 3 maturation protease
MPPFTDNLTDIREQLARLIADRKIVLMGVGNELRGDDAFGVMLAERIEHRIATKVFVTHDLPEDYAVKAADLRPDVVIVLDAIDFHGEPGELHLVAARDVPPTPGVTHRPSLEMMARFLELDAGADTWVLGVQPRMDSLGVGDEMSEPVARALDGLEALLLELLPAAE